MSGESEERCPLGHPLTFDPYLTERRLPTLYCVTCDKAYGRLGNGTWLEVPYEAD